MKRGHWTLFGNTHILQLSRPDQSFLYLYLWHLNKISEVLTDKAGVILPEKMGALKLFPPHSFFVMIDIVILKRWTVEDGIMWLSPPWLSGFTQLGLWTQGRCGQGISNGAKPLWLLVTLWGKLGQSRLPQPYSLLTLGGGPGRPYCLLLFMGWGYRSHKL